MMHKDDMQQLFLDMQEHPENYSDGLLEDVMDNIDREPDAEIAWLRFVKRQESKTRPQRQWMKFAAMFAGVIVLAGITFAAIHIIRNRSKQLMETTMTEGSQALNLKSQSTVPVQFSNAPLDSILAVVATHYDKAVSFRDEAPRRMKLIMTWQPDAPLTDFIERLNAFDGLSLSLQNDTIVVQTNEEEGKQ
jgi:hypothetical protein